MLCIEPITPETYIFLTVMLRPHKHITIIVVCIQEPKRIVLKKTSTQRLSGRFRKVVVKKEEILYIPLLETLACQLKNTTVFEEVRMPLLCNFLNRTSYCRYLTPINNYQGGYSMTIVMAGSLMNTSYFLQILWLFSLYSITMNWKFVIPWDPVVKSTKLVPLNVNCFMSAPFSFSFCTGAFYYLLGNISPRLRSKINNIQLLLLAKYSSVAEFGIDRMLEPIIEDIQKLESV